MLRYVQWKLIFYLNPVLVELHLLVTDGFHLTSRENSSEIFILRLTGYNDHNVCSVIIQAFQNIFEPNSHQ
jgi:hypothetical protein